MKSRIQEITYRGTWPGLGKIYNIKVETGYTTIIVKPGENLAKRANDTKEKLASQSSFKQTPPRVVLSDLTTG
jgi:hypothetical protein